MTIYLICVDQARGEYLAFNSRSPAERVYEYSREQAIAAFVERFGKNEIAVTEIEEERHD